MKRRGAVRSALGLAASLLTLVVAGSLWPARGGWGALRFFIVTGFGMALVFTAVYDGPRALLALMKPSKDARRRRDAFSSP